LHHQQRLSGRPHAPADAREFAGNLRRDLRPQPPRLGQETGNHARRREGRQCFRHTVGVAIVLFVKLPPEAKGRAGSPLPAALGKDRRARSDAPYHGKKKPAVIHHADLWGLRKNKYDWLNVHNAEKTDWTVFEPDAPDFRFVPRNAKHEAEWNKGWSIRDIFPVSNNGLKTDRDELFFDFNRKELEKR